MKDIFEFSTWKSSPEWKAKEEAAIKTAKAYNGNKWIVNYGDWNCGGVRTFLVFAETKDEARMKVWFFTDDYTIRTSVRNVTNAKKYK